MIIDDLEKVKQLAREGLRSVGIYDDVTVKVKKPENPKFLGCYRSRSQFTAPRPIFWIAPDIEDKAKAWEVSRDRIPDIIRDTAIHEYGHVIYEYAELRDKDLFARIKDSFPEEENFAEQMVYYANSLRNGGPPMSEASLKLKEIIGEYSQHFPWKSIMLKEHCENNNIPVVETTCQDIEPEDLRGLPGIG